MKLGPFENGEHGVALVLPEAGFAQPPLRRKPEHPLRLLAHERERERLGSASQTTPSTVLTTSANRSDEPSRRAWEPGA